MIEIFGLNFHAWLQFPVKIHLFISSCITGSFSNDGLSDLLENLNIKENIKNDSSHLDIENALESLKFQVEIHHIHHHVTQIVFLTLVLVYKCFYLKEKSQNF